MAIFLLIAAAGFVAFTNGANANFKGVASLYGSGTTTLRTAAWWGTLTTLIGSITAAMTTSSLLITFSGRGLVPNEVALTQEFITAVALGTACTSFLATRFGFPVSTTHALVGALVGAGLAGHAAVHWNALGKNFLFPLFVSPLLAMVCGAMLLRLLPIRPSVWLDRCHFLSTGAASFARGWNDTPKMVALLVAVPTLPLLWCFVLISGLIALGGLLDIRRVAETLGKRITGMSPVDGFTSSLVTAGLVSTASLHSLPVSTTHVSVGSLVGIGLANRQLYLRKVWEIFVVWLSTVPISALLAWFSFHVITRIG